MQQEAWVVVSDDFWGHPDANDEETNDEEVDDEEANDEKPNDEVPNDRPENDTGKKLAETRSLRGGGQ